MLKRNIGTDPTAIARGIAVNVASLLNYVPALADSNYAAVIEEIATALREYVIKINLKTAEDCYAEGFAAAKEKAAGIAEEICPDEEYGDNCHESIPKRIRAMEDK